MRTVLKAVVVAIVCFLHFGEFALAAGTAATATEGRGERTVLGDLDLRTPAGKQVSLIPLVGSQAIVVVFWGSGCRSCAEEVQRLNGLDSDRLIKVVAVNEGDSVKTIEDFSAKHNVAYEVVVDLDGAVARAFEVSGVPSCVILSRSGLIVYRGPKLPEEIDYYVAQ
ncbi:TlpA family protein disulfide reductase [Geomonas sp. RF6]|uniref:TlpA family protein disulfide reductase n=1 Tax=Geomonas sp. RF6 TaxID=2897342 RepID=UPI001E586071|nr:TlpA disulfide reductase family protein [Geomonas sp. RF6]UFS71749.1 TlpA family protein disulfide reductase [Geomonas sp. RF6]